MQGHKFDFKKLEKLNNPNRVKELNLPMIIEKLNLPSDSLLADIGVGTGLFSEAFLELLPTSRCIGLDISEDMLKWTNENRVPKLGDRLTVNLMQESEMPLEDNIADLAFMILVHHELENPVGLLKDISRVLKKTGKVFLCDWKEGMHHHFVKKEDIISDLRFADFKNIQEIGTYDKFICFIASKN